jgi:hypothetical protein
MISAPSAKHRRVNHHFGILQQRVQAVAIGWDSALHYGEGMRREVQQQQKENLNAGKDHRRVSEKTGISLIAQPKDESVCRQQQRPEQQRAFLA